jgi:hypothetical protein
MPDILMAVREAGRRENNTFPCGVLASLLRQGLAQAGGTPPPLTRLFQGVTQNISLTYRSYIYAK